MTAETLNPYINQNIKGGRFLFFLYFKGHIVAQVKNNHHPIKQCAHRVVFGFIYVVLNILLDTFVLSPFA